MKAIMLMHDSLNRAYLEPYGSLWTKTPNFRRLAQRTCTFDTCYAGSLPCMPARRELHTGRANFLHRSWGPMEPFDDSMPEILKTNGITSCLISDHQHYWEDGGATYHTRYSAWEAVRGQEGDSWKVTPELIQKKYRIQNRDGQYFVRTGELEQQDEANRSFSVQAEQYPLAVTFAKGLDFIECNHEADNWFLQLECFDPHEPFRVPEEIKALFPDDYDGEPFDWPSYHHVIEGEKTVDHIKKQYAALLYLCDSYLGKLLDLFDKYDLWKDTMLIVNTDHGYLLGEHGWWSKSIMPWYDELVHTPLFVHDPRFPTPGERRSQIVQTIDIAPTILEFFGLSIPKDMCGKPLWAVLEKNEPIHDYALFGVHGGHVNVFDGRYIYMKAPVSGNNQPLNEYTLMPMHMRALFGIGELKNAELAEPFSFTKGLRTLKIGKAPAMGQPGFAEALKGGSRAIDNNSLTNSANFGDKLFDMETDPRQENSLRDPVLEARMANLLSRAMKENGAPQEQWERLGLPFGREITPDDIRKNHELAEQDKAPDILTDKNWTRAAENTWQALVSFTPKAERENLYEQAVMHLNGKEKIGIQEILSLIPLCFDKDDVERITYFADLAGRVD